MRSASSGFTLIDVMIVVMIIGLLASIALPAAQNYTARSRIAEALMVMGTCRTTVSEVFSTSSGSGGANQWGCGEAATTTKYVSSLNTTADGAIVVTLQNISSTLDGRTIAMVPMKTATQPATAADIGTALFGWNCGSGPTTVGAVHLPSSCRGT